MPYSDDNWADFFRFTDRTDLLNDERFQVLADRVQHIDSLYAVVEQEAPRHSNDEWQRFCHKASIPCMPVQSLDGVLTDEHLNAVGMFLSEDHPSEGPYKVVRSPVQFEAPFQVRRHAPQLGGNTLELLGEIGYSSEQIDRMVAEGVVLAASAAKAA